PTSACRMLRPGFFERGRRPMRGNTIEFDPLPRATGLGLKRARIGICRLPRWGPRRVGLLLLALVALPWVPSPGPSLGARPARRVRGVGDSAILTFAFAPHGATIATIQIDGRVALRDAAGGAGAHAVLDHRGQAWALALAPDGRSLAVGGTEPDVLLCDVEA